MAPANSIGAVEPLGRKIVVMPDFLEGHTVSRYDGESNHLHLLVLEMGGLVLDQCNQALLALENKEPERAQHVIRRESDVDALELKLDSDIWWELGRRARLKPHGILPRRRPDRGG